CLPPQYTPFAVACAQLMLLHVCDDKKRGQSDTQQLGLLPKHISSGETCTAWICLHHRHEVSS
ncbi:unnamed protein product, partial [Ectocarpus sp. 12 AP-2014]